MHWIEKFRSECRRKDGGTGISCEELAELVRGKKIFCIDKTGKQKRKTVGCHGWLIEDLESGRITHPNIAAAITLVCGGTAENWDSIVHEDYRGQWKPGQAVKCKPRIEDEPEEFSITPKRPKEKQKKAADKQKTAEAKEKNCKAVVRIGMNGKEEMRFNSVSEAAQYADVPISSVSYRCNRAISERTDEFKLAKCTWRFAEYWDSMDEKQRAEEVKRARKLIGKKETA